MFFDIHNLASLIPESFSRGLDKSVSAREMPYGYSGSPPPADTGDFDQAKLESKVEYAPKKGKNRG